MWRNVKDGSPREDGDRIWRKDGAMMISVMSKKKVGEERESRENKAK